MLNAKDSSQMKATKLISTINSSKRLLRLKAKNSPRKVLEGAYFKSKEGNGNENGEEFNIRCKNKAHQMQYPEKACIVSYNSPTNLIRSAVVRSECIDHCTSLTSTLGTF